jgi:hypothetical protein
VTIHGRLMNPSTSKNSPFLLVVIFGQMGKIPKVIVNKNMAIDAHALLISYVG